MEGFAGRATRHAASSLERRGRQTVRLADGMVRAPESSL